MAENTEISQFGKGIALNCGFDLGAQHLLDNRCAVADWNELESIPAIQRADGLIVWVRSEKRIVIWDAEGEQWVESPINWDPMYEYVGEHEEYTEYYYWRNHKIPYGATQERQLPLLLPYAIGGHAALTRISDYTLPSTSEILYKLLFPYNPPFIGWDDKAIAVTFVNSGVRVKAQFYLSCYAPGDIGFDEEQGISFYVDGCAIRSSYPFSSFLRLGLSITFSITRNDDGTLEASSGTQLDSQLANFRLDCPHRQGLRLKYETLKNKFHKAYAASGKEVLIEQTHYVAPNYLVATFTPEELKAAAPDVAAAVETGDTAEVEVSAADLDALGVTPDTLFRNSMWNITEDKKKLSDADGKVLMLASTLPAHTLTLGNARFGSETDNKGVTATFRFGEDSGVFGPYLNLKCHLLFVSVPDGATTWDWRRGYDMTEYEYVEESTNETA